MSEQITSKTKTPLLRSARFWGPAGLTGAMLALGGGYTALVTEGNAAAVRADAFNDEIHTQAQRDGFTIAGWAENYGRGEAYGTLQITPNCALGNVAMQYTKAGNGVIDITSYSFDTKINASETNVYNSVRHHWEPGMVGEPVTFTFENSADLQAHVLGSTPCAELAQQVQRVENPDAN
jgi:hypothetical protein